MNIDEKVNTDDKYRTLVELRHLASANSHDPIIVCMHINGIEVL